MRAVTDLGGGNGAGVTTGGGITGGGAKSMGGMGSSLIGGLLLFAIRDYQ